MISMTPTHKDSPSLRRSEIGGFRRPINNIVINDDEEERRQARRRTIIESTLASTNIEDNETLKNCLQIYNENKLSKDNAWSVSLIDTLSSLLQNHHKGLTNFKVAGSSLEASSRVYGLRVDSIHTDVLRLSAGLNKQKVLDENADLDASKNNLDENNEISAKENSSEGLVSKDAAAKPKQRRQRKMLSTITKNKDSINSHLDIVPLTDPLFGKFNSIVSSINSSNRLLQNILTSNDSELLLRLGYRFWNDSQVEDLRILDESDYLNEKSDDCTTFLVTEFDDSPLRPDNTGYLITDKVDICEDASNNRPSTATSESEKDDRAHLSVAFDIDAESEPIPTESYHIMGVDLDDADDLTVEEQYAVNKCKGLRKAPLVLEDLRPVDSFSNLEYSYRPIDKISQFWAGPSHWKFKRLRPRSSVMGSQNGLIDNSATNKVQSQKGKGKSIRFRQKQINFGEQHDDLFQKLEEKNKLKKANVQKKWDAKKLKLPTDLQIDRNIFDVFRYGPGLFVRENSFAECGHDDESQSMYSQDNIDDHEFGDNNEDFNYPDAACDENWNQTVVEIGQEFSGAPDKVTKIIVPFAKRAKIVDMKQMKKCCMQLINNQFIDIIKANMTEKELPQVDDDKYKPGLASFNEIYHKLPRVLTQNMVESLSPSVAMYSILHLANDYNLRIFPQDDLNDFKIRQLDI